MQYLFSTNWITTVKKIPDSFLLGLVSGVATLSLFYLVFAWLRKLAVNYYGNPYMLAAPKVQLFAIFLNVLLFRFFVITLDKEKFGKGVLMVTVIISLIYFFYYFKYHLSLIGS